MSIENIKENTSSNLCLNCMQEMGEGFYMCKNCGWQKGSAPKELFHLLSGEILSNRYTIGTVIGYGGFGVIYSAWDSNLNRKVAIKELFPMSIVHRIPGTKEVIVNSKKNLEQFNHELKRVLDEAKSVAIFEDNPCIVSVYDYFKENNTGYIVMEYIDGITLKEYLKINGGKFPFQEVLSIIRPIFDALADVHSKKIIHRDLAPDNIFIRLDGTVCVFDFGAARLNTGEEQNTKEIILKPGYSPPEQYRAKAKFSNQTDIYALSAMIYQMLTGEHPPESLDRMAIDEMIPINDFDLEEKVPDDMVNAINRGLAIEMAIRFKTIRDFQAAITGGSSTESVEVIRKKRKIRTRILIAVASFVIFSIIAFIPIWNTYINPEEVLAGGEIKATDITIVVLDNEEKMYTQIKESFESDYPMIDITILPKNSNEYSDFIQTEKSINIFYSEFAGEKTPRPLNLNRLYENLNVDYSLISDMSYENSNWVGLSIDFPLLYCNSGLIKYLEAYDLTFDNVDDISALEVLIEAEKLPSLNAFGLSEKCNYILNNYDSNYNSKIENYSEINSSIQNFLEGDLVLYVGLLSEMSQIDEALQGSATIALLPEQQPDIMYIDYYHKLSINRFSNRRETDASLLFLNYLMNQDAQNIISIQYHQGYPLNIHTQSDFFVTYARLAKYKKLIEKMTIK